MPVQGVVRMRSNSHCGPPPPFAMPYEVWTRVFAHLDTLSPRQFSLSCRYFRAIADDPHARAAWLIGKYGREMALLNSFRGNRGILTPEVGRLMVASGCYVPRFLVQWVDKEYHRPDRTRRTVTAALFVFFMNAGYREYGNNSDFKEDDVARFERCIYGSSTSVTEVLDTLHQLIEIYKFVPVRGLGSPIDETVYLVSKLDINLITPMIKNGLDLPYVNDLVMERVLWRADVSDAVLRAYTAVGFQLTPAAVKKGLQMARPITLEVLRNHISSEQLQKLAEETVFDMFGPSIRGWNFTPEALDFLLASFPISEQVMETAIFRIPGAPTDLPDSFPATRCYMKANPCPAWRWILRVYGPSHRFTMASFDDALSRAAAERDLHALHDVYLEAGVQFRPRHVKILACRVLHRDMTSNALHLMQSMRTQVTSSFKDLAHTKQQQLQLPQQPSQISVTNPPSNVGQSALFPINPSPPFNLRPPSPTDIQTWLRALRDEITENEEWDHRMRTTQLEGGPRGGAYRISRPPEDALRFLDEAREFVAELCPPPTTARRSSAKEGGKFRASVVVSGNALTRSGSERAPPVGGMVGGQQNRPRRGLTRGLSAPALNNPDATAAAVAAAGGTGLLGGQLVSEPAGMGGGGVAAVADEFSEDGQHSASSNRHRSGVGAIMRRMSIWWSHISARGAAASWDSASAP